MFRKFVKPDGQPVDVTGWSLQQRLRLWLLSVTPRPQKPKAPTPAFKTCALCGTAAGAPGNSQKVPDPDQFTPKVDASGQPRAETAEEAKAPLRTIDAAPRWCAACRKWFHAVGCYSTHRQQS